MIRPLDFDVAYSKLRFKQTKLRIQHVIMWK